MLAAFIPDVSLPVHSDKLMKVQSRHFAGARALLVIALAEGLSFAALSTNSDAAKASAPPLLRIQADPRVELMSVLFRLAGNSEYSRCFIPAYDAAVEQHFRRFSEHDAVKEARLLRRVRGVSYDACMSMAVHLSNASDLQLLVPLDPWPETLDRRWTRPDIRRFLEAARSFAKDASFLKFFETHRGLYDATEARMRAIMESEGHLEWFPEFFGDRPRAAFTLTPGLLNGGSCYGARCKRVDGHEDLYCIMGIWTTDTNGLPCFDRGLVQTVVHEFGHSFANPIIDRHWAELQAAGEALFEPVAATMRSQAYSSGRTLLYESLVRACEVRYALRHNGPEEARNWTVYQKSRGFLWTQELSDVLGEYEADRAKYPDLESFAPRLVTFFKQYAESFAKRRKELARKRPKVVSTVPANGAKEVDPGLTVFKVVFDRPMLNESWSLAGDIANYPEGAGQPYYDASRKTWSAPVKLQPQRTYTFMLNSHVLEDFKSEEGVPLEPVTVTFTTARAKAN